MIHKKNREPSQKKVQEVRESSCETDNHGQSLGSVWLKKFPWKQKSILESWTFPNNSLCISLLLYKASGKSTLLLMICLIPVWFLTGYGWRDRVCGLSSFCRSKGKPFDQNTQVEIPPSAVLLWWIENIPL
jgi:hypothetical protein